MRSHAVGKSCDRFNQRTYVDRLPQMSIKTSLQRMLSILISCK